MMNTSELEDLLAASSESPELEFKGPMSWDKSLVKDILALSNVEYGGKIVVGVEDQTWQRKGLSADQVATFDADTMKDLLLNYADPRVEFYVSKPQDSDGRLFVVIDVRPFSEIPVICKKDYSGIEAGTIYFRSKAGKPQSARISSAHDLREIIQRAAIKQMQSFKKLGLVVADQDQAALEDELGGLENELGGL